MNIRLDEKTDNETILKIVYAVIIGICIIALLIAGVMQIMTDSTEKEISKKEKNEKVNLTNVEFKDLFQNKVNYLENNKYTITEKIEADKEIVYTGYTSNENKINDYEINVNIPYINIKNETVEKINDEIKSIFEKKAKSILNSQGDGNIYNVCYVGFVSNNILSLVIKATLKEGNKAQREMVQTFNYDLEENSECGIDRLLEIRGVTKQEVNDKIKDEIKKVENYTQQLENAGYSVYKRIYDSDTYSINNVTEFFMGDNNTIYVVYAYGNTNLTSEIDVITI